MSTSTTPTNESSVRTGGNRLCANCIHFEVSGTKCTHKRAAMYDLVYGFGIPARKMREKQMYCGMRAALFETGNSHV